MQKNFTHSEFVSYIKKLNYDDNELNCYLKFVFKDHLLGISLLNTTIEHRCYKLLKKLLICGISTDVHGLFRKTIMTRNYTAITALVRYGAHTYPGVLPECITAISMVSSLVPHGHTKLVLNMIELLVDGTISSKCLNKFTQILTSDLYINPEITTEHTFTFDLFISLI